MVKVETWRGGKGVVKVEMTKRILKALSRGHAYLQVTARRHPRHIGPRQARALAQLALAINFLEAADGGKSTPG